MFKPHGCYFALPIVTRSSISEQLFDILYQRMLNVVKPVKNHTNFKQRPDKAKFAFFAAFILCEIEIAKVIAEKKPNILSSSQKHTYDDYIAYLNIICDKHAATFKSSYFTAITVNSALSKLHELSTDSSDLVTLLKNPIIEQVYCEIIPAILGGNYLLSHGNDSFSTALFREVLLLQTEAQQFSWGRPDILSNPFMMVYRNFFLIDSEGNVNTFDDFTQKYDDFIIERKTGPHQENKIMLYTKSKTSMMKKIDVFKRWTTRADSTVHMPEILDVKKIEFIVPPIDMIILCHLKGSATEKFKNWYSVDVAPIVPTMVRTLYQRLPAYSNCYGAARVAAGVTPFLEYSDRYQKQDRALTSVMTQVHTGYLQAGDLIYFDLSPANDFHGFIYLDADLVLSMNYFKAPWRFQSTRDLLHHEDFPAYLPYRLCSTYDHVGEYTTDIPWAKVYRKTQPSPCWESKEVLDVINRIYETMIAYPELIKQKYESASTNSSDHPQYPALLDNLTELKELTHAYPHFNKQLQALLDRLHIQPDEIKSVAHAHKKLRLSAQ